MARSADWTAPPVSRCPRAPPTPEQVAPAETAGEPEPDPVPYDRAVQERRAAKAERDLSNGCIRLEDARRFGRWLLGREPVAPSSEPEQYVQLPQGVPVYVTYLTAQANQGQITYSADIYGWDRNGAAQAWIASPSLSNPVAAK